MSATWFGHPRGLTILFLTEMWEKFSFFGMRALLVYYMTKQLLFAQGKASIIYGIYTGVVYLTPIIGGWITDRYLARRTAVIIGGAVMAAGHFMMAFPPLLYPALATIAIGNGLYLPTLPSQIRALYAPGDARGSIAYSIYYVGINLGAFLAPFICGTLGEVYGWHWGFGAAGVGMLAGLCIYVFGRPYLPEDPREAPKEARAPLPPFDAAARSRFAFFVLIVFIVIVFRSAYEQIGNTLALFADAGTNRSIGGWTIPMTWFQSINPFIVFLLTPFLVRRWTRQSQRTGRDVPHLRRMASGATIVAASYLMLAIAALISDRSSALVLATFMILMTVGELHILPVGLGMFGKLAPKGFEASAIALWFSAGVVGNLLAGALGTQWSALSHPQFFTLVAAIAFASAAALFIVDRRSAS
ncbi:MAG TPA: peptide MFS transporter [Nevskiaceae bacterium]|nr:peptide MFS transporter [Nevskiaceae bacterium]